MRKTIIALLLIHFLCYFSCNIEGKTKESEQTKKSLTKEDEKPLVALCQLWGFLKYHHPTVASGKYDWDMELIKLIPEIQKASDETQWKKLLDDWINSLPPVAKSTDKKLPNLEAKTKPDYGELFNTEYFYPETIDKIKYILDNALITSNHYVNVNYDDGELSGLLSISNEDAYDEMLFPDTSYRLLALFRYWNIVNYYFPYRDLCDQKWSSVLTEMLSEFISADNHCEIMQKRTEEMAIPVISFAFDPLKLLKTPLLVFNLGIHVSKITKLVAPPKSNGSFT